MPIRPARQLIAAAGAAVIGAGLIGFAALTHNPESQTRAVALTAGDTEIFVPEIGTFTPTVAEGFPPIERVLEGGELWIPTAEPSGVDIFLAGTDTQTTIGSFVNDDFLESSGDAEGVGTTLFVPSAGSEIDLANFGGGFENEWADLVDSDGVHTTTDTIITPFGNYTLPIASALSEAAVPAVADGYSLSDFIRAIQDTVSFGDNQFTEAAVAFSNGEYPLALSEELGGFNNLTVGVANDVLTNSYAVLTASDGNLGYALENPSQPEDFATALSEYQAFVADAQSAFSLALTDFANGNVYSGLVDLASIGEYDTYGTDAIILGLFDSLPGMVFTT